MKEPRVSTDSAKADASIRKNKELIERIFKLKDFSTLKLTKEDDIKNSPLSDIVNEMKETRKLEDDLAASTNNKKIKEQYKMLLSEHHLALLKRTLQKLTLDTGAREIPVQPPAAKTSTWRRNLYRIFVSAIAFIPISEGLAGGMLLMEDLAEIFTFIPKIAITIASLAFSVLWTYMFYKLEGSSLKSALGVETSVNIDRTIEILDEELTTVKRINKLIVIHLEPLKEANKAKEYSDTMEHINEYITTKCSSNPIEFVEPGLRRAGRLVYTGVSMMLAATTAYFIIQSALTTLAALTPVIITAPWSLLIIIPAMIAFAGYYYTLQAKGAFKTLNPQAEKYEETTKRLHSFREKLGDHQVAVINSVNKNQVSALIIQPDAVTSLTSATVTAPIVAASNIPVASADSRPALTEEKPPQAGATSPNNNELTSTAVTMLRINTPSEDTTPALARQNSSNSVIQEPAITEQTSLTGSGSPTDMKRQSVIIHDYLQRTNIDSTEQTKLPSNAGNNPTSYTKKDVIMFQPSPPKTVSGDRIKATQRDKGSVSPSHHG